MLDVLIEIFELGVMSVMEASEQELELPSGEVVMLVATVDGHELSPDAISDFGSHVI